MTDFDTNRLPRSIPGWDVLLDLIEAATDDAEVEKTWLELKSHPAVIKPADKFAVAKAILAMANRDPARAAAYLDGHGLVVVGAKAGQLVGTEQIEDHVLQDRLAPYLGDANQTPSFDIRWLSRHGKHILVIIVAAPAAGDRIYPLRKALDSHRSGTIFTRPSTKSEPADAAAIDMLALRLTATEPPFDVSISLAPDCLRHYSLDPALLDAYLDEVSAAYWQQVPYGRRPKPEPRPNPESRSVAIQTGEPHSAITTPSIPSSITAAHASVMKSLKPTFSTLEAIKASMPSTELAEDRDPDRYKEDVRGYLEKVRTTIPVVLAEIVALTQPGSTITVINNTDRYLEDVEVKIHIAGPIEAATSPAFDLQCLLRDKLPAPVRPWGPRPNPARDLLRPQLSLGHYISPAAAAPAPFIPSATTASFRTTGSVEALLSLNTLRPSTPHTFDSDIGHGTVLMVTDPELTETEVTIEVTAKGIHSISRQTLAQPVAEPVDLTTTVLAGLRQQLPKTISTSLTSQLNNPPDTDAR